MKNTVIFDMDGVIIDTEPIHQVAYFEHFKELGIGISTEEYSTYKGLSTRNLYQKLREEYNLETTADGLSERKRSIFNGIFDTKEDLDLFSGVRELIENLHKEGFQLILATSSAKVTLNKIFTRFGLYPYFSHIVSGEDFPKSKPDPAIFLKAVELSGKDKSQCIIIEDSTNGAIGAKSAGVFCVGYKGDLTSDQDLSMANMIINQFQELTPEIIRDL